MAKVIKTNYKSYTNKFKALIGSEVKGIAKANYSMVDGTKVLYLKDKSGEILAKAYKESNGKMTLNINSKESSITVVA